MKNSILKLAVAGALATLAASAAAQTMYGDTARVISATPLYERVYAPRRDCQTEPVTRIEERRTVRPSEAGYRPAEEVTGAGAVVGAIIGGVLGHQLGGSSRGRDHGTAAGAVIGGLIGHGIERDAQSGYQPAAREVVVERTPVTREEQRCNEIADTRERIVGYDVRYEYNGREFRARMPYEPGSEIPVNVEVRPPLPRHGHGPTTPSYRGPY